MPPPRGATTRGAGAALCLTTNARGTSPITPESVTGGDLEALARPEERRPSRSPRRATGARHGRSYLGAGRPHGDVLAVVVHWREVSTPVVAPRHRTADETDVTTQPTAK